MIGLAFGASQIAHAQTIVEKGKSIAIEIPVEADTVCNIEVVRGGEKTDVRVESNKKGVYQFAGRELGEETIRWEGKMKFRGLKTLGPCSGDGSIKVVTTESVEAIEAAKQAQKSAEDAKQAKAAMEAQAVRLAELEAKLKAAEAEAAKTPEQKAEDARIAAEAKAYAQAKVAAEIKAAAEKKAIEDARAVAEAKAEAEADAREYANVEAAERERLAPFREKAEQFKKTSKTNWKLTDTKDEMSGSKKVFANAQVRLGLSIVESKVECEDGSVKASFTVFNGTYPISYARGKNDLSALVGLGCAMQGRAQWVNGRLKVNDKLIEYAYCVSPKYRNVVDGVLLEKKRFEDGSFRDFWGMMFEIPTNAGNAVFYFPTADQAVSKVIDACK